MIKRKRARTASIPGQATPWHLTASVVTTQHENYDFFLADRASLRIEVSSHCPCA